MLEKEFKYYKDHQDELVERYNGKFIVIVGEEVVGDFDEEITAYTQTKEKHPLGTFLIQHCLPGKDSYTATFYSRVSFGN